MLIYMKPTKILVLTAVLIAAMVGASAFMKAKHVISAGADNKGFAVVELFTSEGCSSCPPADELVAKIEKESKDKPVYILAYHVDYWNRLGWKDQFSSADYSKRQNEYANYLNLQSVYTPQIVVNGKTEFVGSEEGKLRSVIKSNLQKNSTAQITIIATINKGEATLKYNAEGADKNIALLVAFLQKNAQSKVQSGENGGRTLSHVQIVRKLQHIQLNGNDGQTTVVLPHGFDTQDWEIVGFLQNTANGTVTAATRATYLADAGNVPSTKSSR